MWVRFLVCEVPLHGPKGSRLRKVQGPVAVGFRVTPPLPIERCRREAPPDGAARGCVGGVCAQVVHPGIRPEFGVWVRGLVEGDRFRA